MYLKTNEKACNFIKKILIDDRKYFLNLYIVKLVQIITLTLQPVVMLKLINSAVYMYGVRSIVCYAVIYLFLSLIQVVFMYLYQVQASKWRLHFELKTRKSIICSVMFTKDKVYDAGEADTMLKKDVMELEEHILYLLLEFPGNVVKAIVLCVMIFTISWKLSLIIVFMNIFVFILQNSVNGKIAMNAINIREEYGNFYGTLSEIASYSCVATDVGAEKYLIQRYEKNFKEVATFFVNGIKLNGRLTGCISLLGGLTQIVMLAAGSIMLYLQVLTVGVLVSFMQYSGQVLGVLESLVQYPVQVANNVAMMNKMMEVLEENKEYKDVAEDSISDNGSVERIALEDFSFAYEDDPSNKIYEHANCEFRKGNINLLYGASGEGKTTLFKILMRKCKEYQGKIHIEEEELKGYEKQDIMKVVGYLPQEDMVFRDSISANIKLGMDVTDKEMYKVCRRCEIDQEIRQMEAGYDTLITKENINISGGQIKRMMLSRLLLIDKEILLLDEPTASLDQKSAEKIMKALQKIAKEKLVIMITHDKNAKKYSNRIFEIREGKIEFGVS